MDSPLRVTVYDKNLVRQCWVEDFIEHKVNPRHLGIGTASLIVPTDYRNLKPLAADGARAVVELERDGTVEQVLSGKVRDFEAQGGTKTGVTTFNIEGDGRILSNLLAYPAPATWQPDAGGGLTQAAKSDDRTGPAETVLKGYLSGNLARWAGRSVPVTVAANQGRGATITITGARMQSLAEVLLEPLAKGGIAVDFTQTAAGILIDVRLSELFPITLSQEGGTVQAWKLTKTPYSSTAAVLGGPNQGTSREFRTTRDAAREARERDVIETFVDVSSETITSKQMQKGTDAIDQADNKLGVEITLSESSVFKYGGPGGIREGDRVASSFDDEIDLPTIVSVVNEAELAFTREDGYTASFVVGQPATQPDDVIADVLVQLANAVHALQAK